MYVYDSISFFVLDWEMFQTKSVKKIKEHIFMFNNPPTEVVLFMR
jgi:hypothetical protein